MSGHHLHTQAGLAELGGVGGQTVRDAGAGIDELQPLDPDLAALVASNLAVLDLQKHREAAKVRSRMNFRVWAWIAPGLPQT